MSNIRPFGILGASPGRTITWVETQSQEEVVSAPPINTPRNWGGHPLVRTANHGDPLHRTPERSASPVGGAAAGAAAPEPGESEDDSMVTDKSGSASPVLSQLPFTQDLDSDSEPVPKKTRKGAFRDSGEGGLYAMENAFIKQIIASAEPDFVGQDSEDRTDYTIFTKNRMARYAVLETEKTKKSEAYSAKLQGELRDAQERIRQLEAQIQAGPPPVSPAVGGVQERIRQLEAQIQAGPQPVSPAAGGVGYSPVSPAGGAGCQPVSSDGQNWMMPPFPYCNCTVVPKRPYVPRRIRKGPKQGMVRGACANWKYGENEYKGCGWFGDPFPWPRDLSPR